MKKILLFGAIALSINSNSQVPNYAPTNGLLAWYSFTGNANDVSGNSYNGTNNGATLTTDRFSNPNSAYSFNGTSNYIDVNDAAPLRLSNTDYSISFWTYVNAYSMGGGTAFIYKRSNGSQNGWGLGVDQGTQNKLMMVTSESTDPRGYSISTLPLNGWHHVTVTYSLASQEIKFYIDGLLDNTTTGVDNNYNPVGGMPSPNANCSSVMRFGQDTKNNSYWLNGKLDDIGIWNRTLSECEISDLYNAQLGSLNTSATQTETALDTYTWPINNQTYNQSGTYTAVIPNAAGCDSTITLDLSLDFTGINEFSEENLFTVFPNPAQSAINIKADNKLIGDIYTIYDNTGRVVLTGKLNSKDTTIELNNLSGGIYMFSVGENMKQTFKVIKE